MITGIRGRLLGAAVIPAAPLMLPIASPDQPEAMRNTIALLRAQAHKAINALPTGAPVIVLGAGERGIYDRAHASLTQLGVSGAEADPPVAAALLEHLTRVTQYPMYRGDDLPIEHAVLVLQLQAAGRNDPVVAISVPPNCDAGVLTNIGAGIVEALADAGVDAVMVCAGDLSAGLTDKSPRPMLDGADAFDQAVIDATATHDLSALVGLGPDQAANVAAASWAPLVTLYGACAAARLQPIRHHYAAPAGVGELVAIATPVRIEESGDGSRAGVLPATGDPRG